VLSICAGCRHKDNGKGVFVKSPVDWGISVFDDTVKITAICLNTSGIDAVINYIETPCGCITAIPSSRTVNKNDSIEIDIKYKPSELGYVEKNIFIHFKNRKTPAHFLMKGRIKNSAQSTGSDL
jgi:hypothetical protein